MTSETSLKNQETININEIDLLDDSQEEKVDSVPLSDVANSADQSSTNSDRTFPESTEIDVEISHINHDLVNCATQSPVPDDSEIKEPISNTEDVQPKKKARRNAICWHSQGQEAQAIRDIVISVQLDQWSLTDPSSSHDGHKTVARQ